MFDSEFDNTLALAKDLKEKVDVLIAAISRNQENRKRTNSEIIKIFSNN